MNIAHTAYARTINTALFAGPWRCDNRRHEFQSDNTRLQRDSQFCCTTSIERSIWSTGEYSTRLSAAELTREEALSRQHSRTLPLQMSCVTAQHTARDVEESPSAWTARNSGNKHACPDHNLLIWFGSRTFSTGLSYMLKIVVTSATVVVEKMKCERSIVIQAVCTSSDVIYRLRTNICSASETSRRHPCRVWDNLKTKSGDGVIWPVPSWTVFGRVIRTHNDVEGSVRLD